MIDLHPRKRSSLARRTAMYRAIVCALGLGADVSQANDPIDLGALGAGAIERMSAAGKLNVELLVEAGVGKDWDSAH